MLLPDTSSTGRNSSNSTAPLMIVIPKKARELFHIKPGDTLLLLGDEKRGIAIPPKGAFADLFAAIYDDSREEQ